MTTRSILAVFSDPQCGHRLGLMNPDTMLYRETEDGEVVEYQPDMTESQNYLWLLYTGYIDKIKQIANGDEIVLWCNGDITQGKRFMEQLVSTSMADQILIATDIFDPWIEIDNLKTVRLSIGTGVHVFGEGSSTMLVSRYLLGKRGDLNVKPLYHGYADIDGLRVDVAHHGPNQSSRKWLEGNLARYYTRDLVMRHIMGGENPPDLVLRAHYHQWMNEVVTVVGGETEYTTRFVMTPSFCMMGDHARQATRSAYKIDNGLAAFEIIDGKIVQVHRMVKTIDIRTKEKLI
jgi:hypothetical protein